MCNGSLTAGGPEFRFALLLFLVGCPDRLTRVRELARNALDLLRHSIERVPQPHVVAKCLEPPALAQAEERLVGLVAEGFGLLADEVLDLLVGDLDAELVRGRVEHELAG